MPPAIVQRRQTLALLGATAAAALTGTRAQAQPAGGLTQVATFEQQVTGVAVSRDGRIFVNFPRWEQDVSPSVAEVMRDGSLKPYPNAEWNGWSNLKQPNPHDQFVCVQSVTVDPQGYLWIVDPAAPGNTFIIPGGPKLLKVDLGSNRVAQVIRLDVQAAPQGSYMNDVRVSPDGQHAYLTDSGRRGAIVVVEVASGRARRVLDGHPSTQLEKGTEVKVGGKPLRKPNNIGPEFAADGIALDPGGEFLYWQALTGRTQYRIPTAALRDASMAPDKVAAAVERLGQPGIADGYWMDARGNLYMTSPEDNAVKVRAPDGQVSTAVQDPRLIWPDSLAEGPDGAIYVTASQIQNMAQWHEKGSTRTTPYALYKFPPVG